MKRSIVALLVLVSSAVSVLAPPFEPIRIPQPIRIDPIRIDPIKIDPIRTDPIRTETPIQPVQPIQPSESARIEEAKLRKAESDKIFAYQRVTLSETTAATLWSDGRTYSARARFWIQAEASAIECVSTARAVVVAFLDYIRSIFSGDGSSANWSLDQIARGARRDLRNRGFSNDDIRLNYINQFNETHVVHISRRQLEIMLASH